MSIILPALLMSSGQTNYLERAKDWRMGAVVYQVFVDRFSASRPVESHLADYPAPKQVRSWSQLPTKGKLDPAVGVWTHELEFWGGDLNGMAGKLAYIKSLRADVLYLTPIFSAFTNHKYDTTDYAKIAPEFGTAEDFQRLVGEVHKSKMRIVLDGVFNHIGRSSPMFQDAVRNPESKYRDWFFWNESGYRGWAGVPSLPALKVENPAVRNYLWASPDSIVRRYLKQGIDGWRLDVAYELGPAYLSQLRDAAKQTRPDSAIIGEINGYPADWFGAVDGVFNFFAASVAYAALEGKIDGGRAGEALADWVVDAGIENALRSWILTDNHDTPRLASILPKPEMRRVAQTLQMTLPGCPVIYYGSELGLAGETDPVNRAPMPWDDAKDLNSDLQWMRRLGTVRAASPALRYGDFKPIRTDKLIGFLRHTDKVKEATLVLVNPTAKPVTELVSARVGRWMSWGQLADQLGGTDMQTYNGLVSATLKPYQCVVLQAKIDRSTGYSPYDRLP